MRRRRGVRVLREMSPGGGASSFGEERWGGGGAGWCWDVICEWGADDTLLVIAYCRNRCISWNQCILHEHPYLPHAALFHNRSSPPPNPFRLVFPKDTHIATSLFHPQVNDQDRNPQHQRGRLTEGKCDVYATRSVLGLSA